jgi:hypothetical protein
MTMPGEIKKKAFVYSSIELNRIGVEKLPSPKKVLIHLIQLGFCTDDVPMPFDSCSQVSECFAGFLLRKKEVVRGREARFELAQIVAAGDEHCL